MAATLALLIALTTGSPVWAQDTAADERGLCDNWTWPPLGTKFCDSDAACVGMGPTGGDLACGGCMPSSCTCDPVTGGPKVCSRDCLAFCHDEQGRIG